MYPHLVPDAVEKSASEALASHIAKLSKLVDSAVDGNYKGDADSLAKLVTAMAKLIDAKTKAEASVKPADLARFIEAMTTAINAHVAAPEARANIQRDWRRAAEGLSG